MDALRLDARRTVWAAMSDLFLDTEVRWYVPDVASAMAASGFSREALERIWVHEVVPEFHANLCIPVGGEWAGFDVDTPALLARARRTPGRFARWRNARRAADVRAEWAAAVALYDALLVQPDAERAGHAIAWSCFSRAYLEPTLSDLFGLEGVVERLRGSALPPAALHRTATQDFFPVYASLLLGGERAAQAEREANVRALIHRVL
ncbi:MAG: hypothetical protein MUF00_03970 [Gemmatimonadaceae bacterium]|nr:hypothetical protein [Gemmatimonadaceae bacterium]